MLYSRQGYVSNNMMHEQRPLEIVHILKWYLWVDSFLSSFTTRHLVKFCLRHNGYNFQMTVWVRQAKGVRNTAYTCSFQGKKATTRLNKCNNKIIEVAYAIINLRWVNKRTKVFIVASIENNKNIIHCEHAWLTISFHQQFGDQNMLTAVNSNIRIGSKS